ncbi:MAG: zinc dependent phospholipase C family protein [Methanobacterium sp.]|uniref:zinc dependent phospholipase C family protein n=1 Tax=Methanobacterium sp. TaxID=2164 RepID=UPI003D64D95F|nr:zinc dependent phospholipase C family protein [Methanobacterium sp.]
MNNHIIILLILVNLLLMQIPSVSAWNWNTHEEIVAINYYSLPPDIQQNLDLSAMKDGAEAPDFKFFDFSNHRYPNSYNKASYWLNQGQYYYKTGDYHYASYCYGVASHYITDSFCAPHCGTNDNKLYHVLYEAEASFSTPQYIQSTDDLSSSLYNGRVNGEISWNDWMQTKNRSNIQKPLNQATSTSYTAIYQSIIDSYFIN